MERSKRQDPDRGLPIEDDCSRVYSSVQFSNKVLAIRRCQKGHFNIISSFTIESLGNMDGTL